jgi:hypothetical protein
MEANGLLAKLGKIFERIIMIETMEMFIPIVKAFLYSIGLFGAFLYAILAIPSENLSKPDVYFNNIKATYATVFYDNSLTDAQKQAKYEEINTYIYDNEKKVFPEHHDPYTPFESFLLDIVFLALSGLICWFSFIVRDTFRAMPRGFKWLYWTWTFYGLYAVFYDGGVFVRPLCYFTLIQFPNPNHGPVITFYVIYALGLAFFGFLLFIYHNDGMELLHERFRKVKFIREIYGFGASVSAIFTFNVHAYDFSHGIIFHPDILALDGIDLIYERYLAKEFDPAKVKKSFQTGVFPDSNDDLRYDSDIEQEKQHPSEASMIADLLRR